MLTKSLWNHFETSSRTAATEGKIQKLSKRSQKCIDVEMVSNKRVVVLTMCHHAVTYILLLRVLVVLLRVLTSSRENF